MTSLMIERGADPDLVDNNSQTPLYYAIKNGRYEMVEFLIDKGVKLNRTDNRNQSPAHWAKRHNKTQIYDLLVRVSGDVANLGKKK